MYELLIYEYLSKKISYTQGHFWKSYVPFIGDILNL